ncbi:hypothetical protein RHSP_29947 [Rhizobium freirei PRF 81]|uniref:Uncharacterized protein n=1 Tax=Rhizobium freirei PRF 81 TaxID=363754 RepID=N6V6Q8_9HYPH|nr:hypothetical protein RHSP_29947 [Rhizobium freirei PRF 81]
MTLFDLHRVADPRFFRSVLIKERESESGLGIERGKLIPRQTGRHPGDRCDIGDVRSVFSHFEQWQHATIGKGNDGGAVEIAQPAIPFLVFQDLQTDALRQPLDVVQLHGFENFVRNARKQHSIRVRATVKCSNHFECRLESLQRYARRHVRCYVQHQGLPNSDRND